MNVVTGDGLLIRKEAVGTSDTESEWKITVTVPGSGLPDLRVVDEFPRTTYDGNRYYDSFINGSMEVNGLLPGESWKLHVGSDGHAYTLTFYQDAGQTSGGVLPSPDGQPREIVIRFKTTVNQDWLTLAVEDGYKDYHLYAHFNHANARSLDYRTQDAEAFVTPIRPDFKKSFVERSDVEINGVTYPVFRYTMGLYGPLEDGVIIHDAFNTSYLRFYESEGIQIFGGIGLTPTDDDGTISTTGTTDGMDILVSSFPKAENGRFYPYYLSKYSLIVKDADTLDMLNEDAAMSQAGIKLENTANWGELESSSEVTYSYFPYVDKELVDRPSSENGYVAEFKVIINKYAEDLDPSSDVLAIRDILSDNLRFLPDTLVISPAVGSIEVQHDSDANTLTFLNVPDERTFEISYQVRVLGQGSVSYSNTIQFGKYEKTIEESTVVESSGGGSASNPSITLVKRDADSISTTLAGATFQLHYMQDGVMVPVVDRSGNEVFFTTGDDGSVLIVGNQQTLGWALWTGRTYCLVEVSAPIGYEPLQEPAYFVLSETPSSQIEYLISGDQFSVQNSLLRTSVSVVKEWIGPAAESVTVNLLADGVIIDSAELTAAGNWQHTFANLPQYDSIDGHEIVYKIEEPDLLGYSSTIIPNDDASYTIINTNTATIDIPVTKQWVGPAAQSVTINLTADGAIIDTAVLSAANNWQHTFEDLPKYDSTDGHVIGYDVQEMPVEGYTPGRSGCVEHGFTFTNTITGKVSIPVTKTWVGSAAQRVTVNLLANDTIVDTVELSAENNWQHTFADLDKYLNGVEIEYMIEEVDLAGYSSTIIPNEDGSYAIQNTNTATIDIPVTKQWVGPAAQSVTINLIADGTVIDTVVLSAANNWQHTFPTLPVYDSVDGHLIMYWIAEDDIPGYRAEIIPNNDGSFSIINTNTETIEIPVTKQWVGEPANTVTVNLLADGVVIDTAELSAAGNWQHSFTELPKYDQTDGHKIVYDVQEIPMEGYEPGRSGSVETGFTFTNTITGKVSIPVTKQWIGPAAESVTVNLLANDSIVDTVELNAANNWQHTFEDFPKYDNGEEIEYKIEELDMPGYSSTVILNEDGSYNIQNTNTETIDIQVVKQWVGTPVNSVTINLIADGGLVDTVELTATSNWKHTFAELPKYDSTDGHPIVYDVQEVPVAGYTPGCSGTVETGFTFTNTITGKVSIPVTKQWIGPAAQSVVIELLAGETKVDEVELSAANNWQHTFTNLEQYDNGVEIEYSIRELSLNGYSTDIVPNEDGSYTIINTNTATIDIPVTKQWVGTPANSVTVNLIADGVTVRTVELNAAGDWKYTFENLPKYDGTDGHEIMYDVEEVPVAGYDPSRSGTVETGFTFTNTIAGKVSVPVTKMWVGPAAESVTVELLADGVKVADVVLNKANNWQHTFTDLEQYNDGVEIVYTIREVNIPGYSSKITGNMGDGFVITNTNAETRTIPVEKRWVGTAAPSVTIRLYADGVEIADAVLNKTNNWQHAFAELPKYDSTDGHMILYTISEDSVSGYTTSITGDMQTGFIVTNTKTTMPPSVTPKTGDNSHMLLYLITMILSAAGLIGLLFLGKGRKQRRRS